MQDLFGHDVVPKSKGISRDTLAKMLRWVFLSPGTSSSDLVQMMYSKYDAVMDFVRLCRGEKTGHKISMLFNPHRFDTPAFNKRSVIDTIHNHPTQMDGLARASLYRMEECHPSELLYRIFQWCTNGSYFASEFPPFVCRKHFQSFNAKRILDPCGGWGGRMIGAASLGIYYEAWEPSTKTYDGLMMLGEWLKGFETGFSFQIHCEPFEDATIDKEYDLAYTSPPYYDTEKYSNEPTNSCNRYDTFEEWTNSFYLPMVKKAVKASRNGMMLNIGCRQYDLKSPIEKRFSVRMIPTLLSGQGGLGKSKAGAESFYLVKNKNERKM